MMAGIVGADRGSRGRPVAGAALPPSSAAGQGLCHTECHT